jgi:hemerythrin-like domain-containing protein
VNAAPAVAQAALTIIRQEHATLRGVLDALRRLVAQAGHRQCTPDFDRLRAMLFYIAEFPERQHHVKESRMLFERLRELAPDDCAVLDRLDREHAQGESRVRALEHDLTAWQVLGEPRRTRFEASLDAFAAFYEQHMATEEREVFPLACRVFGETDWHILARAFSNHPDLMAGGPPDGLYAGLHRTLVAALAAPDQARETQTR